VRLIIKYFFLNLFVFSIFVIIKLIVNKFFDGYLNVKFDKPEFKEFNFLMIPLFIKVNFSGPILEEISFRLAIKKNEINYVIGLIFYFLISPVFLNSSFGDVNYWIIFGLGSFYYLFLYYFKHLSINTLIFVSAFVFGTAHLTNFSSLNLQNLFPCWFNIIPQIISGVFLAKLRIFKGIKYSILFHIFNNLLVTCLQIYVNK
jgi:hypothetical protein